VPNWLVTGAAGFIGSHTLDALLSRGDAIVGIDNFNGYYDPAIKRRNLEAVRAAGHPGELTFREGDFRDEAFVEELFSGRPFDGVIHLAAMAGVRASIDDPELYIDVNVMGTQRLLSKMVAAKTPHLVLASTSSVYGTTEIIPFVPEDRCDTPMAPYAASKRAAEHLSFTSSLLHGHSTTVLRFFTVYGPRNRPDMMAFKVLQSIHDGIEVPVYAGGEMWRDWTFVGDIVRGVIAAADRPKGFQTLNLGRGEPVHLGAFIERLESLAGKKANLVDAPRPDTDVVKTWADVTKTREALDYVPTTSLAEGTLALYDWYRQSMGARR
jgi:UDP-glucuronate 4-epimerase